MILWTNLHVVFKFVYHEPYRFGNKCTNKANNCFPCFLYICITPEQINIGKIWSVHKPYIKKERQYNGQQKKDKQWFTKHCTKPLKTTTGTPQNTEDELMCSGRVSSSCSTSHTRRVTIVTNSMISHDSWKYWSLSKVRTRPVSRSWL